MGFYADLYKPSGGETKVKYMCDTMESDPYCGKLAQQTYGYAYYWYSSVHPV